MGRDHGRTSRPEPGKAAGSPILPRQSHGPKAPTQDKQKTNAPIEHIQQQKKNRLSALTSGLHRCCCLLAAAAARCYCMAFRTIYPIRFTTATCSYLLQHYVVLQLRERMVAAN